MLTSIHVFGAELENQGAILVVMLSAESVDGLVNEPISAYEAELLMAIADQPEDMAPRLVYADWLQERGIPRGEFIAVQVAIAELDEADMNGPHYQKLAYRERQLFFAFANYVRELCPGDRSPPFSRGFVVCDIIVRDAAQFAEHHAGLWRLCPCTTDLKLQGSTATTISELVEAKALSRFSDLQISADWALRGGEALVGLALSKGDYPRLKELRIEADLSHSIAPLLAKSPNLVMLRLGHDLILPEDIDELVAAELPALRALEIPRVSREQFRPDRAIRLVERFPKLERLQLNYSYDIDELTPLVERGVELIGVRNPEDVIRIG